MTGIVVRSHSNQHFVAIDGSVVRCHMRGRLRKQGRVHTGDRVTVSLQPDGTGVIEDILPRRTLLTRPLVANVDRAIVIMSLREPDWQPHAVDRLLVLAGSCGLDTALCLNKADLAEPQEAEAIAEDYRRLGVEAVLTSARLKTGIEGFRRLLTGGVSVLCGLSGTGKSSLLNAAYGLTLRTGEVSGHGVGRHTTRRAELMIVEPGVVVVDTPGFSSVEPLQVSQNDLDRYFPDIADFTSRCRYSDCRHDREPECAVKDAVDSGQILQSRYDSYLALLAEIRDREANKY